MFPGHAYRKCDVNGSWVFVDRWNKTWTNYSECLRFLQPDDEEERVSTTVEISKLQLVWLKTNLIAYSTVSRDNKTSAT